MSAYAVGRTKGGRDEHEFVLIPVADLRQLVKVLYAAGASDLDDVQREVCRNVADTVLAIDNRKGSHE